MIDKTEIMSWEENKADVRLALAAPELLSALKDCMADLKVFISHKTNLKSLKAARAVIAKVEGK